MNFGTLANLDKSIKVATQVENLGDRVIMYFISSFNVIQMNHSRVSRPYPVRDARHIFQDRKTYYY